MSSLSLEKNAISQEDSLEIMSPQIYSTGCIDNYNVSTIIKPRKVIAKMKANNRKGYKRKQIEIVPIITLQLQNQNKYLLYGFIEIESYYKDYPSPYEIDLVDLTNAHTGVSSIERSTNGMDMVVNFYTKASSGLRDFQFLIDHYQTIPDQQYQELAKYLKEYKVVANKCMQHISDLSIKLKQRLISYEEIQETQEQFRIAFEEFVKSQVGEEDFYLTSLSSLNLDFFEVEVKQTKMSLALLSLIGVEPRNFEMSILRNQAPFLEQFGFKRLKNVIQQLFITVSDAYEYVIDDQYYTADNIPFYGQSQIVLFDWKERPSWLSKEECSGVLVKLNVSLQQIKAILEIRSQMSSQKQLEYGMLDDDYHFEYTVESEIFIERYYPEAFSDQVNKKSLQIKQEMMQNSDFTNFMNQAKSENENSNISEENVN
ncbi:hypothetical protein TTHERM_00189550 (macronuclear) [Tetrahymena thermophila SB210]|uniref:Uncharacterized protein n=1 Tax=Tetrahymena thermophila (strain SB210) TaxID=312017 RepID=I7M808_TETTS|nr:hypothetical protein TTHERM_00189550 [Tetrahymena thermophila SB210]EAR96386.1 hypothetical protein TTHERM_00189550 [Tetrahymena thermophila SB210]|eukprot:XP_001016631.1 hypothetical protein TTHERM_00189550 [Tetrahymena thermophila SB210]